MCAVQVPRHLGWIFRPQLDSDYGIDAHVETVRLGYGSGRLLAAQVKSGKTGFKEPKDDGWVFRPKNKHVGYWLAHSLPVYLLLVDLNSDTVYWQIVNENTLSKSSKGGWKIHVPSANTIQTARTDWERAADSLSKDANKRLEDNLKVLSPQTRRLVEQLGTTEAGAAALLAAPCRRADERRP